MTVPGALSDPSTVTTEENVAIGTPGPTGYVARPANPTDAPGIIVIHEAFGLNDHIKDIARRFAGLGYTAAAPDLYWRTGSPDPNDFSTVFATMFALKDSDAVADLVATAGYLREQPGATGKVGCIGFCSGGRQTLLFASSAQALDAAVDCWGGFIDRATSDDVTTPSRPTPVIDLAEKVSCPIFIVGGAQDENPSPETLATLDKRLNGAGKQASVKIFPEAGHAFFADYRPSYHEQSAFELWDDVTSFFQTHLR